MNKRQMERLELLFSEGKTLEEAREHFPDSWKMPREADFQANITAALQEWRKTGHLPPGTFWWKESASPYQRRGIPDLLMVAGGNGRLCAFEVKRPWIGRVSDSQKLAIKDLQAAGAVAAVVRFPGEVRDILKKEGIYK